LVGATILGISGGTLWSIKENTTQSTLLSVNTPLFL
jgi:hypothetical protein